MSNIESEEVGGVDDELPNTHVFRVEVVVDWILEIVAYLMTSKALEDYIVAQRRQLVTISVDY